MSPRHRHVRVILTAGVLEPIDEAQALHVRADGSLKKPFEATALLAAVRQLAEAAASERSKEPTGAGGAAAPSPPASSTPFVAVVDAEQVRAAVVVALDASMDAIAEEISRRVVVALQNRKSEAKLLEAASAPASNKPSQSPLADRIEAVRRIHPLRIRSSMLGLEAGRPESE
jgi:DNA-binding response OmpR family regulator